MLEKNWLIKIPDENELEEHLEKLEDKIDYHQTILNIGYKWWQEAKQPNGTNYSDMINYISSTYGEVFAGLILIGKYNQQVGNGGNIQYFYNGYADGIGGCNSERDYDHPLHRRLIIWLKKVIENLNFENNIEDEKILIELNTVLREFLRIPIDLEDYICDQEFIVDEENEDDLGHWEPCESENPEYGQMDSKEADNLDKRYYAVAIQAMEIFEKISKNLIVNKKLSVEL
jgi:hypothetical protein